MDMVFFECAKHVIFDFSTSGAHRLLWFNVIKSASIKIDADYIRDLWAIFRFLISQLQAEKIEVQVGATLGAGFDHFAQELGNHWPPGALIVRTLDISLHYLMDIVNGQFSESVWSDSGQY